MARVLWTLAACGLVAALAAPAFAHHAMGGALPGTFWQGLLSGLGHPVIGLDHFAFVVGVGAMSYLLGRMVLLPLMFVAGSVVGCALHIGGHTLPAAELAIAVSVAVAAALVATRAKLPAGVLAALLLVAGVFHGYAYGESIVGAEATPLAAYMVGFAAIQGCVAVGSALALRAAVGRHYLTEAWAMRLAGAGLALVAVVALATAAMAG